MVAKKGNTTARKPDLSARHIHPGNGSGLRPAPPQQRTAYHSFRGKFKKGDFYSPNPFLPSLFPSGLAPDMGVLPPDMGVLPPDMGVLPPDMGGSAVVPPSFRGTNMVLAPELHDRRDCARLAPRMVPLGACPFVPRYIQKK